MAVCINLVGDATIFLTIEANCRYWQVQIPEVDQCKSVFTPHHDLFHFNHTSVTLIKATGTFQRAMDVLLPEAKWQIAFVHLVDIVIILQTASRCIHHVRQVLALFYDMGLILNLKKRNFFTNLIDFLGDGIRLGHQWSEIGTVDDIGLLKFPANVTKLKSTFESSNFAPRFAWFRFFSRSSE